MRGHNHLFLHDLHGEDLAVIKEVTFTPREIDVISCLINGRNTKKMSSLLSISPSTIETHIKNIKLKIGCHSRDSIVDFVEQSQTLPLIRQHYGHLVIFAAFEKALKAIKKENSKVKRQTKTTQTRLILYGNEHIYKDLFFQYLEAHLKQAGIDVEVEVEVENANNTTEENKTEKLNDKTKILLLILEPGGREKTPKGLCGFEAMDISKHQNYYFLVFEILKNLLQHLNLTQHIQNFSEQYEAMENSANASIPFNRNKMLRKNKREILHKKMEFLKNKKGYRIFAIFCILLGYYALHSFKENKQMSITHDSEERGEDSIRSDLPIPISSVLLDRPEEIAQIDKKLKGTAAIETIVLVGPGGIGKTVLSRQYAHQQKANVIWEINAETPETLKSSFEDLAQALARTEKDQKILIGFQDIKDSRTREKKLIQFVKQHLRSFPCWILIYDNVGTFQDIQPYFPQDAATWGQGKIILTTQNSNIQNNKYVKSSIQIKELNPLQKLTLFMNIATHENLNLFTKTQREEANHFLENIPSFPLDVSVAAYYLKTTNVSYDIYLKNLNKNNTVFTNIQENILKETGNYIKTRYGIITLSLQNLMKSHKDFNDLLLIISLLDSQHIPKSLLDAYQKDVPLVDSFIFDLKKYSLITNHAPFSSSKASTFSIHRSTQAIILDYLIGVLNLDKNHHLLQTISQNLEDYIVDRIEKEDLVKLRLLVSHCERFLKHDSLLTEQMKHALTNEQAGIYLHIGNYLKAKQLLESNLSTVNKKNRHSLNEARAFAYLGNVYGDLGHYEKAKDVLEQSVSIYQKYFPDHHAGLSRILAHLGNVYRDLGNFEKAKHLLEQSLFIHQKYLPRNSVGHAWISAYLGITYTILGEYDKAIPLLEQSLTIYKQNPKNGMGVAWVLAHQANLFGQLGEQEKAKALFEQSIALYKEHFPEGHIKTGWALSALGETYRALKEYDKAKDVLEQSLKIYKKHLSENHVVVAGILVYLGAVHKDLGDLEKAKSLLDQSLVIYKEHFPTEHVEIAWALAHLGDIHRTMGNYPQAKALLEKSLSIYGKHFPEDHVEVIWAKECLKNVSQELGEHGGAEGNRKGKRFGCTKNKKEERSDVSRKQ